MPSICSPRCLFSAHYSSIFSGDSNLLRHYSMTLACSNSCGLAPPALLIEVPTPAFLEPVMPRLAKSSFLVSPNTLCTSVRLTKVFLEHALHSSLSYLSLCLTGKMDSQAAQMPRSALHRGQHGLSTRCPSSVSTSSRCSILRHMSHRPKS